jgi:hypothetical protein
MLLCMRPAHLPDSIAFGVGVRCVGQTVTLHNQLFFVVIQRLYLASAAAKAMAAIHKDLGSRLAEITCSVEEHSLPNQVVTM